MTIFITWADQYLCLLQKQSLQRSCFKYIISLLFYLKIISVHNFAKFHSYWALWIHWIVLRFWWNFEITKFQKFRQVISKVIYYFPPRKKLVEKLHMVPNNLIFANIFKFDLFSKFEKLLQKFWRIRCSGRKFSRNFCETYWRNCWCCNTIYESKSHHSSM